MTALYECRCSASWRVTLDGDDAVWPSRDAMRAADRHIEKHGPLTLSARADRGVARADYDPVLGHETQESVLMAGVGAVVWVLLILAIVYAYASLI